ncbi:hypothetical protein OPT61_g9114 [Boeremia exigua]|uniref:Uncharacterized protein n=1 Tax=Boeremia exigua TaxID=749465 RepID=A0ACC2HVV6_9PLEO|nr:hypothetical protein OPT61_g9114 [Boeremia exigua]
MSVTALTQLVVMRILGDAVHDMGGDGRQANEARHAQRGGDAQNPSLPGLAENALIQNQHDPLEREDEHNAAAEQLAAVDDLRVLCLVKPRYLIRREIRARPCVVRDLDDGARVGPRSQREQRQAVVDSKPPHAVGAQPHAKAHDDPERAEGVEAPYLWQKLVVAGRRHAWGSGMSS